ncbi:hypothetical protein GYB22_03655 [bacterium]|nr:hypothetical protein [bacterium]
MSLISFLILICAEFSASASEARTLFHKVEPDEDRLEVLLKTIDQNQSNTSKAYYGLCEAMMAEYAFWPADKYDYFKKGKVKIEAAIKAESGNPELRYIRLMVQLYTPSFLGYSDQVQTDLNHLRFNLKSAKLPQEWKLKFVENLIATGKLSESQTDLMITLKKELKK